MKKMKVMKRIGLLTLALLMLGLMLVSCAGGTATADYKWTAADENAPLYFSRILLLNAEAQEKFIAAYRGYDMSAEGFDDSTVVVGEVKEINVEAAKKALEAVKPADDASKVKYDEFRNNLTAEEVTRTVELMKANDASKVDLSKTTFPGIILVWIGKFLQVLTKVTGGYYVLALFIFAVIVEILLLYFGIRQQQNSIKQARLSPKERAIRKKYAGRNDQVSQRRMQEEIQKLYQEEGFNPMGGCLPLLIQMPIVIALYNIVIDPLRYVLGKPAGLSAALTKFATTSRAAGGLGEAMGNSGKGTIELLSKLNGDNLTHLKNFQFFSNAGECAAQLEGVSVPNFGMFGMNMGLTPSFKSILIIIPILTFVFYFASMKLNRKFSYQPAAMQNPQMGCSNNMMDITMPLMSVYIAFITPAAVGVYWIFKCIIGTLKQFLLHKFMPLPTFTEEDYKRAEKEMKAKNKGKKEPAYAAADDGRVYRSLHHIDDEEELPPKGSVVGAASRYDEEETTEMPAIKEQDDDRPMLKDDRKNRQ